MIHFLWYFSRTEKILWGSFNASQSQPLKRLTKMMQSRGPRVRFQKLDFIPQFNVLSVYYAPVSLYDEDKHIHPDYSRHIFCIITSGYHPVRMPAQRSKSHWKCGWSESWSESWSGISRFRYVLRAENSKIYVLIRPLRKERLTWIM